MLKLLGYAISCVSVVCLGIVSWSGAAANPLMLVMLIIGMATSVLGMAMRFWAYFREKQREGAQILISK